MFSANRLNAIKPENRTMANSVFDSDALAQRALNTTLNTKV